MAGNNRGMILWTLGGAGVFLIYAAYKNQNPQTLLLNHLNGTNDSKPISVPTTVPTITDSQGKTWNTAPGDGGYITTDPPTPGAPAGSNTGPLASYPGVSPGRDGVYNLVDRNGLILGTVPTRYQNSPATYIPQAVSA